MDFGNGWDLTDPQRRRLGLLHWLYEKSSNGNAGIAIGLRDEELMQLGGDATVGAELRELEADGIVTPEGAGSRSSRRPWGAR